ncbi:phage minor capsid protein [Arthrobacter sp. GMC3]|uniref:phage minor capsid protein n=1 Tax=Arthrobacter sp. GMC3 TaxID=2058894 RepID=UPI000CE54217|nr:phage minor capsid protein [Arthrobacter sp. GMC3]
MRPDDAANLAKAIRELFADAETSLIAKVAATLAKGLDDPGWAQLKLASIQGLLVVVDEILAGLATDAPGAIEKALTLAYSGGSASASAGLASAVGYAPVAPNSAISTMVASTVETLPAQMFQIRRAVTDMYQQVITRTTAQVSLGVLTRREASRAALVRLAQNGITSFQDKSGRRWNMASYTEMAVRSGAMNASLQGVVDRLARLEQDLVIVDDAIEECRMCRPFEGKVLSLTGARRAEKLSDGVRVYATLDAARQAGLFHNNCRHAMSIYLPGITKREPAVADPEGNALREQQRAFERRIRELKRRDAIDQELGGPEAAATRAKLRAKQQEFKAWREDNGRKNLSYRTNTTAR